MSNFKPVIEDGKILVCMRDEFGQDEAWYLSFDEIKIALGEAAQQSEKAEEPKRCPECDSEIVVCMMGHYCGPRTAL